ncbi:MAG TPA: dodecin family protein [Sphingobacteriaceae bacterium]|nr:dodecin family protein [Sphingobacteriaceae bacterium]
MEVVKVVELVGQSKKDWFDAVEQAVTEAARTIDNISGVEVYNLTANVQDGKIVEWKANVKLAFAVDNSRRNSTRQASGRVPAQV